MRKSLKVMIEAAEQVCEEWEKYKTTTTWCLMDDLVASLRAAIKKVKGIEE